MVRFDLLKITLAAMGITQGKAYQERQHIILANLQSSWGFRMLIHEIVSDTRH